MTQTLDFGAHGITLKTMKRLPLVLALAFCTQFAASAQTIPELQAKVAELQATIESLRKDNAALRAQLSGGSSATATATKAADVAPKPATTTAQPSADPNAPKRYWISDSGTRHNDNCRYFGTTKGHEGTADEGKKPCKACGG